jgi:glycine/D-amino acid oxidase-like deaminating enzyme
MYDAYLHRIAQGEHYIQPVRNFDHWNAFFRFSHGAVLIQPAYWVDLQTLLAGWRNWLQQTGRLIEDYFEEGQLQVDADGITYRDIKADYIFYCDGFKAEQSKYWSGLPFSLNKGEALIADIPGLPQERVYKFGVTTLVPWQNGQWWVGSNYDNNYSDELPTALFRKRAKQLLEQILNIPFTITDHLAAIRPTNLERRPFAGFHPHAPRVGILGGMGTKGVSIAPWLSKQVAAHLIKGDDIEPAANVNRFRRAFDHPL